VKGDVHKDVEVHHLVHHERDLASLDVDEAGSLHDLGLLLLGGLGADSLVELHDVVLALTLDHVVNDVVLGIQNDVPQLSEILNHVLRLHLPLVIGQLLASQLEAGVVKELLNERVEDSAEDSALLGEPGPTGETESGVGVFEEVNHVVDSQVLLLIDLGHERLVDGVVAFSELPEDGELLDGLLLLALLSVLQILNHHAGEYLRHQLIESLKVADHILSIHLLVQNRPQVLNNFLAMSMATLHALFHIDLLLQEL
jgi:hypothetical protein